METLQKTLKHLPHSPGVYVYKDQKGSVIYVGKAIDLFRRVHQYFQRNDALGEKTQHLVSQIVSIETIRAASEFDSLILEAKLIRAYQPKYNVIAKDDKSPLYILLTFHELFPRVLCCRKNQLEAPEFLQKGDVWFGPFQSAKIARSLLFTLRRSIPYCTQKTRNGRPCFYTHLGLCAPCPSAISVLPPGRKRQEAIRMYRHHIRQLRDVLSGKSTRVMREMEKTMHDQARRMQFEEAEVTKRQLENLQAILARSFGPTLYIQGERGLVQSAETEIENLRERLLPFYPDLGPLHRIECVDISNTGGQEATGSLVVLTRGIIDTSRYRRFTIRLSPKPNDGAMIAEVMSRRLSHSEWQFPDLLVIDGGKGQVAAASRVLKERGIVIPVIGLAKRFEEVVIPRVSTYTVIRIPFHSPALHLLQRIRDEAHRFALSHHRRRREKKFFLGLTKENRSDTIERP